MPSFGPKLWRALLFVASAAVIAWSVHRARSDAWWLLVPASALVGFAVAFAARALGRRRVQKMLLDGRAEELLSLWQDSLEDLPHPETTVPLIMATALTASGQTERARSALARASRGRDWPAAHEHRLLIETLLDSFEGERAEALNKAAELSSLPLPSVNDDLRGRVALLREAVAAVARAFAHQADARDADLLWEAARRNALIHWPLRYAAAVACIDGGQKAEARRLLADAPTWPEESAFRAFHAELLAWARGEPGID
jgi:hypothetical protein